MQKRPTRKELDEFIDEITLDAATYDEKFGSFLEAFSENLKLPASAFIFEQPVQVVQINYDGQNRLGLMAQCVNGKGSQQVIGLAEVVFSEGIDNRFTHAAYRMWLGMEPAFTSKSEEPSKAVLEDIGSLVELTVINVKRTAARCYLSGTKKLLSFRSGAIWDAAPGETLVVETKKKWRFNGHTYLSGKITSRRIEIAALNCTPLALEDRGVWDPAEEYWREDTEARHYWEQAIFDFGPRGTFEMEQVVPGENLEDGSEGPILQSIDEERSGNGDAAQEILMNLLEQDLRCLDAHCHLGNLYFETFPKMALKFYEIGKRIGELSFPEDFHDTLPWGWVDNRPYLRCLKGYGLCLWRLNQYEQAAEVIDRILWLNPMDNQGVRGLIGDIRAKKPWGPDKVSRSNR